MSASEQRAPGSLPRLCDFNPLWRLGVFILVVCLLGGYAVAGMYLRQHYENRDERPGISMTDIRGAYAGVRVPSSLRASLERGHPEELPQPDRDALITWLDSDRVEADYENFDLGDAMPADIIAISCLECHSRDATGENTHAEIPLEYPDDIFAIALSREIKPKDMKIIVASIHAHAPSMACVAIISALLAGLTRWPRPLVGLVVVVAGAGLLLDFVAQVLARNYGGFWPEAIVLGGFGAGGGVMALGAMVLLDLLRPRTRPASTE